MQNKGAIRLFAILLALVSLYQLIFTFHTRDVEKQAEEYALQRGGNDPSLISQYRFNYLDSMKNEVVYNFLFGLRKYTYQECKEREINFGLDLKGGMNLILEIKVEDIIKALSNYSQDETFHKALKLAREREKSSTKDFTTLFGEAFEEVAPDGRLAAIFNTVELREKVDYNSTNEEVLNVIREEAKGAIDNAFNILRTRIDRFGVTQPNIQRLDQTGRILIELPGVGDPERVKGLLQGTANLEFWETYNQEEIFQSLIEVNRITTEVKSTSKADSTLQATKEEQEESDLALLDEIDSDSLGIEDNEEMVSLFTYLAPSGRPNGPVVGLATSRDTGKVNNYLAMEEVQSRMPRDVKFLWTIKPIPADEAQYWTNQQFDSKEELFQLIALRVTSHDGRPPLEGDAVSNARAVTNQQGSYEIEMAMNSEGAKTWARLTKANIKKSIAIVLDGYVYSFPTVQNEITGGRSSITGDFTPQEAKDLANVLQSGKMPAPARVVESTVVGPSLGSEAVNAGLTSFIWAFIAVLIYMILYYGVKAGLVADLALIANMFFIMGVLAAFNAVLTLPGIAGIVLTIGMSVDANVLIYERIREELRAGKGLKLAIADGYKNAFSAIIDANITTFLTGLILFSFGTGPIKGFATTLMIGIATSFFSAIFITRLVFERLMNTKIDIRFSTNLTDRLFSQAHIKFIEKRKLFFVISGIVILLGVLSLSFRGLKQGIDFTGGRSYVVRFEQAVSASDIQSALTDAFEEANVEAKTFGSDHQIRITTNYLIDEDDKETDDKVVNKLYEGLQPFLGDGVTLNKFLSDFRQSSQKVGPTIATDIRSKAGYAIFFSLIVIFLYILIRFRNWEYGIGAIGALVHDVLIVLGAFSLLYSVMPFSMEIDQSFIAAVLTVIGYSINDTVVVFDRIREYRGLYPKRELKEVFNLAMNSTISRTINTSLTTLVVLLVIFLFGSEVIQGFVFALIVGVVVGTYSSLFIASPIAFSFIENRLKKGRKK
ncbi:protein translocase subunit SecDF [Thermophagus sp. OGC60D27]|uniref:protein translocase subunit SecDF n=1 Tax=Thermophagus sp. OGC60D27 TaxID=3458415 RepID=UPI004037F89C